MTNTPTPNKGLNERLKSATQENEELLPCPVCKKEAYVDADLNINGFERWWAGCDKCEITTECRWDKKVFAIKQWNKVPRPAPSTVSDDYSGTLTDLHGLANHFYETEQNQAADMIRGAAEIITALSSPPVSTQTDNAELVEKINQLERSAKDRIDTGFPICPEDAYMIAIQDFREAISALTQVSPSEGVVISTNSAWALLNLFDTDKDIALIYPSVIKELRQALQEHDNG